MTEEQQTSSLGRGDLPAVAIALLKGVVYRDGNERLWAALLELQTQVRDYVAVLGLELVVDEAEGYAFVKSRAEHDAEFDGDQAKLPRLIVRRPLSFPVSLLLALLRKKLAEWDAGGGDTRLVLAREDIVELARVFLPASTNEARLVDQIDTHVNKIVELGFLRRMKTTSGTPTFEVRRILKAFVDAQWLLDFDARLAGYRAHLQDSTVSDQRESRDE
ncbi:MULTISPECIES: DUF4194 domain-containing protein [Burkholderia]|uniref:Uncharacterized protein DUF4194 n=1 Tax=Burkholderia pyrrocinia TaxID=60550 RepID=A0A318IEN2_BURPY|nr:MULTISPECIES: DUF4194 domain-containing protein [Burkholderia]PXX25809.1 uncharacterized protein DUF4194 [Burkholderia pyrrocinia]SFW83590.1 protein of unknown function [Burkholderia sp. NFACC33-1]SFY44826.1 protein of unknown function [Burkholderia sp. NFPP32]